MSSINPYNVNPFFKNTKGNKVKDILKNIQNSSKDDAKQDRVNISYNSSDYKSTKETSSIFIYERKNPEIPLSESAIYRQELESAKTQTEVRDIQNQKIKYFMDEIDKVNNSDLSTEKKQELLNSLGKRLIAVSDENHSFKKSGKISTLAAKEKVDLIKKLEKESAAQMKDLQRQMEAAEEAAKAAADEADKKIKCIKIASRILSGDKVPPEDHKFLMDNDSKLYTLAISCRMEKEDPEKHKRISEDEEKKDSSHISSSTEMAELSSDGSAKAPPSNDIPE